MPCTDYGRDDHAVELKRRLDTVTRLLCEAMNATAGDERVFLWSDELTAWWAEHQRLDAERKAAEQAASAIEQRRIAALRKLSPDEITLLRIR